MYAKIFQQIYDSSIVEDPELRFTFMDLLILADKNGVVDMTHEAIARRTNRPIDLIRSTIQVLESPDGKSRTAKDEGRRLRRLDDHRDWGWLIVNYDKFRAICNEEQRREKTRERVSRYRKQHANEQVKENVTLCNDSVTLVTPSLMHIHSSSSSLEGSVEGNNSQTNNSIYHDWTLADCQAQAMSVGLTETQISKFFDHYNTVGWVTGTGQRIINLRSALAKWKTKQTELKKRNDGPPM